MITLIVGLPRVGKTWYVVEKLVDKMTKRKTKTVPVVSNIRGHVDIAHKIDFKTDFTDSKYDNHLIVLDEVQFYSGEDAKGEMFRHFTIHGHSGRNYLWITQSVAAIPRKWQGLVETTIDVTCIAGSQFARAREYERIPKATSVVLSEHKFKPCKSLRYKSTEENADVSSRSIPMYFWKLSFSLVSIVLFFGTIVFFTISRFTGKAEPLPVNPLPMASVEKSVSLSPIPINNFTQINDKSKTFPVEIKKNVRVNSQITRFPLSLDDALAYLEASDDVLRPCNGNIYTDSSSPDCTGKKIARRRYAPKSSFILPVQSKVDNNYRHSIHSSDGFSVVKN